MSRLDRRVEGEQIDLAGDGLDLSWPPKTGQVGWLWF